MNGKAHGMRVELVILVADANPFGGFEGKGIDSVPGTKPPIITMYTPTNNTTYFSSNITVSFLEPKTTE